MEVRRYRDKYNPLLAYHVVRPDNEDECMDIIRRHEVRSLNLVLLVNRDELVNFCNTRIDTHISLFAYNENIICPMVSTMFCDTYKYTGPRVDTDRLPVMLQTDPVAKWLGFKAGDIVEVHTTPGVIIRVVS